MLFPPLYHRNNIPFYYNKSEQEFRQDTYEHYDPSVIRQTAIHLGDELWSKYPFQAILDIVLQEVKTNSPTTILEIGCSVGRKIGSIAQNFPSTQCYGIDYSYQLLRQAYTYWKTEKVIEINLQNKGLNTLHLNGIPTPNLQFALAKAEQLPFPDECIDLVFSSFLLDRVDDPIATLQEQYRILKKGGHFLLFSPLNFQKASHWEQFYPLEKLSHEISQIGFSIPSTTEIIIKEPLDFHGNHIVWKVCRIIGQKISN